MFKIEIISQLSNIENCPALLHFCSCVVWILFKISRQNPGPCCTRQIQHGGCGRGKSFPQSQTSLDWELGCYSFARSTNSENGRRAVESAGGNGRYETFITNHYVPYCVKLWLKWNLKVKHEGLKHKENKATAIEVWFSVIFCHKFHHSGFVIYLDLAFHVK